MTIAAWTMENLRALSVTLAVVLHVVVWGYWTARGLCFRASEFWARQAVRLALGLTLFGFEVLVLGQIRALSPGVLCVSTTAMLAGMGPMRSLWPAWREEARRSVSALVRENRILTVSCGLLLLVVLVSGLRAPQMTDEVDYHWAAPVLWARASGWVPLKLRFSNGPALMEMIYTASAVFHAPTAAHWTHTLCLLILLAGGLALARVAGASLAATGAACLSCPVIVNQASIAYNDLAAASLAVCAFAALLCGETEPYTGRPTRPTLLTAGLLFAGAVSVKPFTLVALPIACLYAAWAKTRRAQEEGIGRPSFVQAVWLCAPVALALCVWMAHTHALNGHLWDSTGQYIAHTSDDPMWQSGAASGRIPNARDLLTLPFVPAISTVLGQHEPYGSRTGPLLLTFVPLGLFALRSLSPAQKGKALWLLGAALGYFFLLGPIAIKIRFHLFVWTLAAVCAGLGLQWLRQRARTTSAKLAFACFYLLMWAGMIDEAHVLLQGLPHLRFG